MKTPPANTSIAAQRLRLAAINFGVHSKMEPVNDFDSEGRRRNAELLLAAIAYAKHVDELDIFMKNGSTERSRKQRKVQQKERSIRK